MADNEVRSEPTLQTPRIDVEKTDEYSRYLLHSRTEIVAVLRSLIHKTALITIYFDHGQSFLLTSMLALSPDNNRFVLDIGADAEMNRKALHATRLVLTTQIDKVKIQFSINGLSPAEHEGRPAFAGKLPDSLLRLQRREFFRLSTPIANPVNMNAIVHRPDGSAMNVEIPLFDISGGGIGLMMTTELAQLLPRGTQLSDCRIPLPDEGLIVVSLIIRNTFDVTTRSGGRFVRAGCEFIDVPSSRLNMIQRYITRIERERKARLSGLG